MKVGKPKSKRVPVRLRHKIEKASAAKQRKQRKEAKKNPQWRSRLKKDPGIPNLFPHKDKVLAEIEEGRRRKEEEAVKRREVARARRQGLAVEDVGSVGTKKQKGLVVDEDEDEDEGEDEDLVDAEEEGDGEEDEDMDEDVDERNPMAALLASAEARAQGFGRGGGDDDGEREGDDDEDGDEDEDEDWEALRGTRAEAKKTQTGSTRKILPKQALEDPVKAVSVLLERLQRTLDGMQKLLDYYQIPPLVTAGSDTTTRFLVEVARKRGRLGRGGIPNLPSAALTVLGDLNEERLQLPGPPVEPSTSAATKGEVQIVSKMAEPFRIEGLFGDGPSRTKPGKATDMEVEA